MIEPPKIEPRRSIVTPRLVLGLALIFVGVVYTLHELDYLDADEIIRYWPAILVLAGLAKLLWPGGSGGRFAGVLLVLIGGWLLAWEFEYTDYDPFDFWPVLFVIVGLRILYQAVRGPVAGATDESSTVSSLAVLGATRRTNSSSDFRGGDLAAFMGGCEADLRQARIAAPAAVIDTFAMWGGVEIIVPRDWHVRIEGWPILGGFEDKTGGAGEPAPEAPRQELVVRGFAIMGGVEIKN